MAEHIIDWDVIRDGYNTGRIVLSPVGEMAVPAPGEKRVGALSYQTSPKTPLRCWEYIQSASKIGVPMSRLIDDALLLHMDTVLGLEDVTVENDTQEQATVPPAMTPVVDTSNSVGIDVLSTKLDKIITRLNDKDAVATNDVPQANDRSVPPTDLSELKKSITDLRDLIVSAQNDVNSTPQNNGIDSKSIDAIASKVADVVNERQEASFSDMKGDIRSLSSIMPQQQVATTQEHHISIDTTAHDRLVADMTSTLDKLNRVLEKLDGQEKTIADVSESVSDCTDEVRACSDEVHLIASSLYEYDEEENTSDDNGADENDDEDVVIEDIESDEAPDGEVSEQVRTEASHVALPVTVDADDDGLDELLKKLDLPTDTDTGVVESTVDVALPDDETNDNDAIVDASTNDVIETEDVIKTDVSLDDIDDGGVISIDDLLVDDTDESDVEADANQVDGTNDESNVVSYDIDTGDDVLDDYEADFARTVREILGKDTSTPKSSQVAITEEAIDNNAMDTDEDYGVSADEFIIDDDGVTDDDDVTVDYSDIDDTDIVSDDSEDSAEDNTDTDVDVDTDDIDFEQMFDDVADDNADNIDDKAYSTASDTDSEDGNTANTDFDIDEMFGDIVDDVDENDTDNNDGDDVVPSISFDEVLESTIPSTSGITVPQRRHGHRKARGKWRS